MQRKTKYLFFFLYTVCIFCFLGLSSCKKDAFLGKGKLSFSHDTLVFDTIFTTIGSTTKQFKIYNKDTKTVTIESIQLMGGNNSPFRLNVDGLKGSYFESIEIEGKDSLFAFVEVTLSINNQNLPLIVEDSIRFVCNGKEQYVKLAVWGQDAYFHYKDLNEGTWANDKPHVIYGYAAVDSAKTLTIPAGTTVHLHKNSLLYVYKGSLHVEGQLTNKVIFQGDRLEQDYDAVSGQYYGIYFHEAQPSTIQHAILKNGTAGIHLYSKAVSSDYTLTMENTEITNHARYGIFIYSGARVKAENCIIAQNGTHALLVLEGGDFNFNFCNLLGYGSGTTATPAVGISNFYSNPYNQTLTIGSVYEGIIRNSVVYGNQNTELVLDTMNYAGVTLNFNFHSNLIKMEQLPLESFYTANIWNSLPQFTNVSKGNYGFTTSSPLNNNADPLFLLTTDIFGTTRSSTTPDIGAIEN